jgi:DNA mismatch repair protein MutS2
LDELGTSTDPAEGSAISRAILLHFLTKQTMAIATTHLGDLKVFAHATDGLQNASLDINPLTLTPTYHLTVGLPGGSNAIATAARLGMDKEIIGKAQELLSGGSREVEILLTHLSEEKDKMQATSAELEKAKTEALKLKNEWEKLVLDMKTREKFIIQETRDRVVTEAAELQRELRQAASELRKGQSRDSVEKTRKALANVQEKIRMVEWQPQNGTEKENEIEIEPDNTIVAGDSVLLKDANLEATVLKVDYVTGAIEVQAGQTRIKMSLEGVDKVIHSEKGHTYVHAVKAPPTKIVAPELMMLGRRAEEVEDMLNKYLDDASLSALVQVRIVHGSGTGVLRQIVRDMLRTHPLVKSFRPGENNEGGNGVTIVRLGK